MSLNIIVTVKQVPDTQHISSDAMTPEGTVNRHALPAVINPDDLYALEEALKIKERIGGSVVVITMGPHMANEVLKECLYRGADDVILLSDRRFAGSDTLATSYILKCAIQTIGKYDLVICGRQAIDGDTAQVGPQLAEKLGINQLTYVFDVMEIDHRRITVKRAIENGYEVVRSALPALLTVSSQASEPRPPSVKRAMAYKNIDSKACEGAYENAYLNPDACSDLDHIKAWDCVAIQAKAAQCGITGSPTRVKKVENIVFTTDDMKSVPDTEEGLAEMVRELIDDHILV